ncbi:MAG: hypothetical protein M1814_005518 [Vezdaea aestivalis]|nr:MAG: hypothetical protein M1814_005518 [Vezdaea aestivalis]
MLLSSALLNVIALGVSVLAVPRGSLSIDVSLWEQPSSSISLLKSPVRSTSDREEAPFDYIPPGFIDPQADYGGVKLSGGSIIDLLTTYPDIHKIGKHHRAWVSERGETSLSIGFTLTTANEIEVVYGWVVEGELAPCDGLVVANVVGAGEVIVEGTSGEDLWVRTKGGFQGINGTEQATIRILQSREDLKYGRLLVLSLDFDFVFDMLDPDTLTGALKV